MSRGIIIHSTFLPLFSSFPLCLPISFSLCYFIYLFILFFCILKIQILFQLLWPHTLVLYPHSLWLQCHYHSTYCPSLPSLLHNCHNIYLIFNIFLLQNVYKSYPGTTMFLSSQHIYSLTRNNRSDVNKLRNCY